MAGLSAREARWELHADTTNGSAFVPGSLEHLLAVFDRWLACAGRLRDDDADPDVRLPVGYVGVRLHSPSGEVTRTWGEPPREDGRPWFQPMRHLTHDRWADCRRCGRERGVGQMIGSVGEWCAECTFEHADPWRRWPRLGEVAHTVPRPTRCVRCRSTSAAAGRRYIRPVGWHCKDCAPVVEALLQAQRWNDRREREQHG